MNPNGKSTEIGKILDRFENFSFFVIVKIKIK